MDTKAQLAEQTRQRELLEDTLMAVSERICAWQREGRLAVDVRPLIADREGDTIMVWLSNGAVGIILMDEPERSTLNGV